MSVSSFHADEQAASLAPRRLLAWLLLAALAALLAYSSFRAYLGPDFLLQFANAFHC